jgi:nicotinamidase/pyrazinamidase
LNKRSESLEKGDALILVDVQNDFLPGGKLAVKDGDKIIPVLNHYISVFQKKRLPVYASRDWHPPDHCSFKKTGGIWPEHCVQNTSGAEFSSDLNLPAEATVISKATTTDRDAYSALDGTNLDELLKKDNVKRAWVGGLATDYCVINTVLDLISLGYNVYLLTDAIRAVNVKPNDGSDAEREMISLGARPMTLEKLR